MVGQAEMDEPEVTAAEGTVVAKEVAVEGRAGLAAVVALAVLSAGVRVALEDMVVGWAA